MDATQNGAGVDPGEGWRLLVKGDKPEPTVEGDELWFAERQMWQLANNWQYNGGRQAFDLWYRRRAEPQPAGGDARDFADRLAEKLDNIISQFEHGMDGQGGYAADFAEVIRAELATPRPDATKGGDR